MKYIIRRILSLYKGATLPALDKQLHFLGGFCIAAAVLPFGMAEAAVATFVAAIAKELYD